MKQLLVFVLLASMLCWLMFSPIYKHVLIVRQAVMQKEVDLLLEIGTNAHYGYIDEAMISASKQRLLEQGFEVELLDYVVRSTLGNGGTSSAERIHRGQGIELQLSYPYADLLSIDQLIGIKPPSSTSRIVAGGMKMSEYVAGGY